MDVGHSLTGARNRVGRSQLAAELYRIEREQKAEIRMHNTSKQRFKAKYSKLDGYNTDRRRDSSDVRMYETHNPGFCYRRNGECRIPQAPALQSPSVDFEDIHSLLFSQGEVDIEKVLCLHILTAHKTETLTPPSRYQGAVTYMAKEQSPLERLIERSRKKFREDNITKLLPTYVLEINTKEQYEEKKTKKNNDVVIRDGRLAARVIINDKIVQLVHTVMSALQHTNTDKLNDFLKMVKDPQMIKKVVEKPYIQEFLDSLTVHTLFYSCESFHLTQPFRAVIVPLELETSTNTLERLINHIRKSVLQLPTQSGRNSSFKRLLKMKEDDAEADMTEILINTISKGAFAFTTEVAKNLFAQNKSSVSSYSSKKTISSSFVVRKGSSNSNSVSDDLTNSATAKEPKMQLKFGHDRNVSETAENRKTNYYPTTDIINEEKSNDTIRSGKIAPRTRNEDQQQGKKDEHAKGKSTTNAPIKQTTSPTSVKSNKNPATSSKIQKTKKESISSLDNKTAYTTSDFNSTKNVGKLSTIIDEEPKNINTTEERTSKTEKHRFPLSNRVHKMGKAGGKYLKQTLDAVELDFLDLAKIAQEIKEKEVRKKLNMFLAKKI